MDSETRLPSNPIRSGTLWVLWLALGLLVLPLLVAPRQLSESSATITGDDPELAVPNLPPTWMRSVRGYVATGVAIAYPLAWVAAVLWAYRLRRRERYALSLLPIGLPVLAVSPLLAILAADKYREATAAAVIRDLATDGSRAWVTASSDNERNAWLATIDLTTSGEPRESSVVPLEHLGWVHAEPRRDRWKILGVAGKAAVLSDLGGGIFVLDLQSGKQIQMPNNLFDAAALAHPDLLLTVTFDGMVVSDLTAPLSRRVLARLPEDHLVDPQRIQAMQGARALVVSIKNELWAYDFEDPAHPRRRGKWVSEPNSWFGDELVAAGPLVLALTDYTLLHVIDFSDPDNPSEVGRLTLPEPVHRLTASGTVAAVAALDEPADVLLVDLSQPRTPTLAARVIPPLRRFPNSSGETGYAGTHPAFAIAGTRMLVAAGNVLEVLDVSNPSSPHTVGRVQLHGR
jgi:hypothetical protein